LGPEAGQTSAPLGRRTQLPERVPGNVSERLCKTFYETPADIHTVGMNASDTESAKILVFFVKQQGEPVSIPVP